MAHYIDADRLRAEINRLIADPTLCSTTERKIGGHTALLKLVSFLDSLQQEQPEINIPFAGSGAWGTTPPKFKLDVKPAWPEVDINKEIDDLWKSLNTGHDYVVVDSYQDFLGICMHCFELGLNARKEDK